jgi:Ca2+-binding RTX toxin-like protein
VIENAFGNAFDDKIVGKSAPNSIDGGGGADSLSGGAGNDTLVGGEDDDTLTGGAGNDIFYFAATNQGVDLIADFAAGDRLEVAASLATGVPTQGTGTALTGRQVQVSSNGTVTTLWVDTDGTSGAELQIRVTGNFAANQWIVEPAAANAALPGEGAAVTEFRTVG